MTYECLIPFSVTLPRGLDAVGGWSGWGVRVALHGLGARATFSDRRFEGIFIMEGLLGVGSAIATFLVGPWGGGICVGVVGRDMFWAMIYRLILWW